MIRFLLLYKIDASDKHQGIVCALAAAACILTLCVAPGVV